MCVCVQCIERRNGNRREKNPAADFNRLHIASRPPHPPTPQSSPSHPVVARLCNGGGGRGSFTFRKTTPRARPSDEPPYRATDDCACHGETCTAADFHVYYSVGVFTYSVFRPYELRRRICGCACSMSALVPRRSIHISRNNLNNHRFCPSLAVPQRYVSRTKK